MRTTWREFSEKPSRARLVHQERLLLEVTELLAEEMKRRGVSRAELAKRLGKSKAFVTQVLRGRHNMTVRTLADLTWALAFRIHCNAQAELDWSPAVLESETPAWFQETLLQYGVPKLRISRSVVRHESPEFSPLSEVAA